MTKYRISLSNSEKISFLSNLSTMLAAGISILEAIDALLEDSKIRLSILIGSILLIILIAVIYFAAKKPRGKK